MVVKMMKWRPWPPLSCNKFKVKIVVHKLKGLNFMFDDDDDDVIEKSSAGGGGGVEEEYGKLAVKLKWIGSKGNALNLSSLKRNVKRNFTKKGSLIREDGVVEWNEEFSRFCNFLACKEASFYPWEISFTIFNGSNKGQNDKVVVLFKGSLNLTSLILGGQQKDIEVNVPMGIPKSNNECKTTLCLSISLMELRNTQEHMEITQGPVPHSLRSSSRKVKPIENNEISSSKNHGKVRFLRALSTRRSKKEEDGKSSDKNEEIEYIYPSHTDLPDDHDNGDESQANKSFSYESLSRANYTGHLFNSSTSSSEDDQDLMYFGSIKKDSENVEKSPTSVIKQSSIHGPISSILPWRKRKLSFKPFKEKGEPLLRKDYGDDGGDDIDLDRRQFRSSDESKVLKDGNRTSISEFEDNSFTVGCWEQTEIMNRDGNMILESSCFFGSIDQMSEKADGESACTSLAVIIAEWFQSNTNQMPIKSQFDRLIRDGSTEWRYLCENEIYKKQFPDQHFDLDTVLESKPCSISLVPDKSFIGFFHPDRIENNGLLGFDYLDGAMSFDNIWEEISQSVSVSDSCDPIVYIISWNDHFFVLKIDHDAFYIIDTLGERLFNGCKQAYILKFDTETTIYQVLDESRKPVKNHVFTKTETRNVLYKGKESCKEYIKNFLAAIPIRQLQIDVKNGLMDSTLLHQRLQIEFHYTKYLSPESEFLSVI